MAMVLSNGCVRWKEHTVLCVCEEVEMLLFLLMNYLKCIAAAV